MTRKLCLMSPSRKWLQMLLLAAALAFSAQQAPAQMTGDISGDMAIIHNALAATVSATGKADAETSRVNMEELYRQWRIFRARNFESQAADPSFVPSMEKVEASLFAASRLIDNKQWPEANNELRNAQKSLQTVHPVAAAKPKVDETGSDAEKRY